MNLETNHSLESGFGFCRIRSHVPALVLSLICACLSGCSIVSPSNSDDHLEFGDPYEIRVTNPSTGEPSSPFIANGQLSVVVSYGGGCEDHEFELNAVVASDSAKIWIEHDANGDLCEAYLTKELHMEVSESVLRTEAALLLDPNGGAIDIERRDATSPNLSTSERDHTPSGQAEGA